MRLLEPPALRPAPWNARRCVGRTLASAAFLELDEVNEAINSGEQTEKGTFEHKIYSILTQSGNDLPPGAAIKRSPHFLSRRHLERHLTPNRVNTSIYFNERGNKKNRSTAAKLREKERKRKRERKGGRQEERREKREKRKRKRKREIFYFLDRGFFCRALRPLTNS